MPTDIYIVIQVLPDNVLAVEVLLSCTGCTVTTWLALRWDRSQAYADWTCLHSCSISASPQRMQLLMQCHTGCSTFSGAAVLVSYL